MSRMHVIRHLDYQIKNKHHAAYVTNFNKLVDQSDAARLSGDFQAYTDLTYQLKFNGGGALNHEFFWDSLSP